MHHDIVLYLLGARETDVSRRVRKTLSLDLNSLASGAECSFRLSGEFAQSLGYLPIALSYLHSLPAIAGTWSNDVEWASRGIASFLKTWRTQLQSIGVFTTACVAIESIMAGWNQRFIPDEAATEWPDVVCFPPSAILLNAILEAEIPCDNTTLFDELFHIWSSDTSCNASSANLLAFYLFVRLSPDALSICVSPLVLNGAFDEAQCAQHWESVRQIIQRKCPDFYVFAIRTYLLGRDHSGQLNE